MPHDIDRWRDEIHWLRGLALRLVRDPDQADELVQETALIALRRSALPEKEERAWRAGVLKQLFHNRRRARERRRKREQGAAPPAQAAPPESPVEQLEVHQQLTAAILALDEPYRETVVRRYFHDHSSAEIARSLGEPEATVRSRLSRALARLREELDRRHGGDRRAWVLPIVAWIGATAGASSAQADSGEGGSGRTQPDAPPFPPFPATQSLTLGGVLMSGPKIAALVGVVLLSLILLRPWGEPPETKERASNGSEARSSASEVDGVGLSEEGETQVAEDLEGKALIANILGQVSNRHTGAPLGAVHIELVVSDSSPTSLIGETESNTLGAFSLEFPREHSRLDLELRFSTEHYVPSIRAIPRGSLDDFTPIQEELGPGMLLAGVALDLEQQPVVGAEVYGWGAVVADGRLSTAKWLGERHPWPVTTDTDGRFEMYLPPGDAAVIARTHDAFGSAMATLPATASVEVHLARGLTLEGTVHTYAGEAVSNAVIRPYGGVPSGPGGLKGLWSREEHTVRTGDDGSFALALSGEPKWLWIEHPLHATHRYSDPEVGTPIAIVLPEPRSLIGRFVDEADPPIGFAGGTLKIGQDAVSVTVGDDGQFSISPLEPRSTSGTLRFQGAVEREIAWPEGGGVYDLGDVSVDAGRSVFISIVDARGLPIPGARIRAQRANDFEVGIEVATAVTGSDGTATLRGIPEVHVIIAAAATGYGPQELELGSDATSEPLTLILPPEASLSGRWLDPDGAPLAGVRTLLVPEHDRFVEWEYHTWPHGEDWYASNRDVSGPDGRFSFSVVPADSGLWIQALAPGFAPSTVAVEAIASGESRDVGDLVFGAGAALRVVVTTEQPGAIAGARCEIKEVHPPLRSAQRELFPKAIVYTDIDGVAKIRGLPLGELELTVTAEGWATAVERHDLNSPSETLHVRLGAGQV